MSRLMLKSAKRASPVINLCSFRGLGKTLAYDRPAVVNAADAIARTAGDR